MNQAYLSLGSNQGNREEYLSKSIQALKAFGKIIKKSSIIETKAWGKEDQADFLNQVILIQTNLSPEDLLQKCQNIETKLNRKRIEKWGPRTIDIDILFYNDLVLNTPQLQIPHPYIPHREFVLNPLSEISPNFIHPTLNQSISVLLENHQKSL